MQPRLCFMFKSKWPTRWLKSGSFQALCSAVNAAVPESCDFAWDVDSLDIDHHDIMITDNEDENKQWKKKMIKIYNDDDDGDDNDDDDDDDDDEEEEEEEKDNENEVGHAVALCCSKSHLICRVSTCKSPCLKQNTCPPHTGPAHLWNEITSQDFSAKWFMYILEKNKMTQETLTSPKPQSSPPWPGQFQTFPINKCEECVYLLESISFLMDELHGKKAFSSFCRTPPKSPFVWTHQTLLEILKS